MPIIGNKRVSQLVEMTAGEVELNDLFLIIDTTAQESKRIQASQLSAWLNASGSVFAIHANFADTASYITGADVDGAVLSSINAISASIAGIAQIASQSLTAVSSSYAFTSSFALNAASNTGSATASFLQYTGVPNGTASFALNAANANTSQNTSFLNYFGGNNGTASHAIVAEQTNFATNAATASYFNNQSSTVLSSSYAVNADTASFVKGGTISSASYLTFSPNNGTASYAIRAGSILGVLNNYGLFPAIAQSSSGSIIDNLTVNSSLGTSQQTIVQAIGNAIVNFTASFPYIDETVYLYAVNRKTGESASLDSQTVNFDISPLISAWGSHSVGTTNYPFNLLTQVPLFGEYYIEVSSSSPSVQIDTSRTTKFLMSSFSDQLSVQADVPMQFFVSPSASVVLSFSSSAGGPFHDKLPGMLATGSQNITWIDVNGQGVTSVLFTWKLPNLNTFVCSNNPLLSDLSYSFPPALNVLVAENCSLTVIADLNNTTASALDVHNNQLQFLPLLSPSMSYLDCSNNPLLALPNFLPTPLTTLLANNTNISGTLPILPNGINTVVISNTIINNLQNPLPLSMSHFEINSTLISSMSAAPISLSYLDVSTALFNTTALENVTTTLVANGQVSGTFKMLGYGPPTSPTLINNIFALTSSHWTIFHD